VIIKGQVVASRLPVKQHAGERIRALALRRLTGSGASKRNEAARALELTRTNWQTLVQLQNLPTATHNL
jgi:hypothetical protein